MAEEQIIIEVVVDSSAAQKSLTENTKAVDNLNQSNKELRATNKELSKDYKANSAAITQNNTEIAKNNVELTKYKQGQKAAAQQLQATNNSLNAQKAALAANKREIGDVNTATKEGRKRYNELSNEILEQTNKLKEAEQAQGTFTRSVGDYGQALNDTLPAVGGTIDGLKGMTKSALAFIATPLGAVLGLIAGAVALVSNAMNRNEESSNKMNKVISKLSSVFSFLLKALEPVGEFLIDVIVVSFDLAAKAAEGAITVISSGLSALGFDEAAKSVDNFTDSVSDFVEGAGELADMEAELVKAQRIAQKVMLDFQKEAEVLRQIRDDESKSFQERIKANNDLGNVLNKQLQEEKAIAQLGLDVANERIKIDGETVDNLDARAEALTNIADIEERITGQRSEQLINLNSLEKDRAAKSKEQADARIAIAEQELETEREIAAEKKAINDELIAREEQAAFELDIFKRELAANEIEDAQLKADALVAIEQDKSARLLENEKLTVSERLLIQEESDQVQNELQEEADESKSELYAEDLERKKAVAEGAVSVTESSLDLIGSLSSENADVQKGIAITQAGINVAQGVTAALGSAPPPVNFALAGITGAAGAVQIAKIAGATFAEGGINADYSNGGIGKGTSHKFGGIQMFSKGGVHTGEFQGGEAVMKKEATEMFKPQLSAMNVAAGGKSFYEDGGINLAANSTSSIDSAIMGDSNLSNMLSRKLPIEVAVTDINKGQDNVDVKQRRTRI